MTPLPCSEPGCIGHLLPLSDFGPPTRDSATEIRFKAWACSCVKCRLVIYIDHGRVFHSRYNPEGENGRQRNG